MNFARRLTAALLLLASATTAQAQWTRTPGPTGGTVRSVAYDGTNTVAVLNSGEIFRRDASATAWTSVSRQELFELFSLDGAIVANGADGIVRTTDGGATWHSIRPTETSWILGGSGTTLYALEGRGTLRRSTDAGSTWKTFATFDFDVQSIDFDETMIAVGRYEAPGVMRSTDDGQTWVEGKQGFPKDLTPQIVTIHNGTIYAAAIATEPFRTAGVYRSTDRGDSWHPWAMGLANEQGRFPHIIEIFTQRGGVGLLTTNGIYRFGGHPVFRWLRQYGNYAYDATVGPDTTIYVATLAGVVRSTFSGWEEYSEGMASADVNALHSSGGVTVAAANDGVHRTTDGGGTWTRVLTGRTLRFVATSGALFSRQQHLDTTAIHRSTDDGLTWTPAQNGIDHASSIATMSAGSSAIFVGRYLNVLDDDEQGTVWRAGGVHRSTDDGATWSPVNDGLPQRDGVPVPVASVAANGTTVIAFTALGTFRSIDNGDSWEPITIDTASPTVSTIHVHDGAFYAATIGRVLRSLDGALWTEVPVVGGLRAPIDELISVGPTLIGREINASPTALIYALDRDRFVTINDKLPDNTAAYSFSLDGDRVMLGTHGAGVWRGRLDVAGGVTGEHPRAPLAQIVPNPATARASVVVDLAAAADVTIELLDIRGDRVHRAELGATPAGTHAVDVALDGLDAGVYVYRVIAGGGVSTGRFVKR